MKKFLTITTSLVATLCAIGFGNAAVAFAETDEADTSSAVGGYPTSFDVSPEFESLNDYAVGNGEYLFLDGNVMYKYGSGNVVPYKDSRKTITHLYFDKGEFYYETKDGKLYALTNFNEEDKFEDFTLETPSSVELDTYYYFKNNDAYYFIDQSTDDPRSLLEGFDNIKKYGNKDDGYEVYAVRTTGENKQVLCTLNGKTPSDVQVKDFNLVKNIAVGDAYTSLTSSAGDIKFVDLTPDAYMTKVELDKLTDKSSTYFASTDKPVTITVPADTRTALLLYTDNVGISIIAVNGESYLIHPQNASLNAVYPPKDLEGAKGTATMCYMYSSPFESKGTRIKNANGDYVRVSGEIKIIKEFRKSEHPEFSGLDGDFFLIKYETAQEDGETATFTGYVRCGLISTYTFNEDPPTATHDPEETYADLIKPVVLILLVLLLIAIAAGYLIYVGTSDKRKKKREVASSDSTKQNKQ